MPRPGSLAEAGTRDGLAAHHRERGRAAPVERLARVRVLLAEGEGEARLLSRDRLHADAEGPGTAGEENAERDEARTETTEEVAALTEDEALASLLDELSDGEAGR